MADYSRYTVDQQPSRNHRVCVGEKGMQMGDIGATLGTRRCCGCHGCAVDTISNVRRENINLLGVFLLKRFIAASTGTRCSEVYHAIKAHFQNLSFISWVTHRGAPVHQKVITPARPTFVRRLSADHYLLNFLNATGL